MPWFNDIDDTRPTDLEFVSEGAERFRELKRALIERLSTAYKSFPDENPDRAGEALLFPIASVRVGTQAQRPEAPEREGAGWFSSDTGVLWVGNRDLQWQFVEAGQQETGLILTPHGVEGSATMAVGETYHMFDVGGPDPAGFIMIQAAVRAKLLAVDAIWSDWIFNNAASNEFFLTGLPPSPAGGEIIGFIKEFHTIARRETAYPPYYESTLVMSNQDTDLIGPGTAHDFEWQAVYWYMPFAQPNFFPLPQLFGHVESETEAGY